MFLDPNILPISSSSSNGKDDFDCSSMLDRRFLFGEPPPSILFSLEPARDLVLLPFVSEMLMLEFLSLSISPKLFLKSILLE